MKQVVRLLFLLSSVMFVTVPAWSQGRPGGGPDFGGGPGYGGGRGMGPRARQHAHDDRHDADRSVFHFLLQHHNQINRSVKELPNGVETLTESDSPEVAEHIQDHVKWMQYRIEKDNPIRMRDPLFAELFKHTDKIKMLHENTEKGVRVVETSNDPYVVKLIQAHAKVVSGFVKRGFTEAMTNHTVPAQDAKSEYTPTYPVIAGHGPVVQLQSAAHQPRSGAKMVVDLTRGGEPDKVNPGLEKVAKYVNIYAGGGGHPAKAKIAVVFHGDATLAVLDPDAYSVKFNTEGNPNLALLRQLHQADVELFVCGQSLISKGGKPDEVAVFVETVVSAVVAVVNLQSDDFAYVPLGN